MTVPDLDIDLFDPESLVSPYAGYRRLRDAAAMVRLRSPDVFAMGRFADVQNALRAPDVLISGDGVGFSPAFNAPKGMNVLQSDGELHARLRATVMRPLAPSRLREGRTDLRALITGRIGTLAGQGWFDAMKSLAPFLPVHAVSHLVGLPEVGRERMLDWASATFNLIGPEQNQGDLAVLGEAFGFLKGLSEETVRQGSWAGDLFVAAKSGRLSLQEAMAAISAYVIPSLDTTILAKGHLLNDLATEPEQWALIKQRPELIPAAVLESVRRNSVLRWFSRVASVDYDVEGLTAPQGSRIMLLYGCANRDERRYPDPECFDVERDNRDQLAWGTGAHMCAGMHLARMEMEVLMEALVECDARLTVGDPVMGANRGLYGYSVLPLQIDLH